MIPIGKPGNKALYHQLDSRKEIYAIDETLYPR